VTDQVNRAKVNGGAREGALGHKVNAACGRAGSLGCCEREYPLGDERFGADKETGKGAAAFVNNAEYGPITV